MGFNPTPVRCQIQGPLKLSVSDPGALKAFSLPDALWKVTLEFGGQCF